MVQLASINIVQLKHYIGRYKNNKKPTKNKKIPTIGTKEVLGWRLKEALGLSGEEVGNVTVIFPLE